MSSSLLKVVYFDESSVIDYLQIFHKGKVEQTLEKVSKLDGEGKADGDVGVFTSGICKGRKASACNCNRLHGWSASFGNACQ